LDKIGLRRRVKLNGLEAGQGRVVIGSKKAGKIIKNGKHKCIVRGNRMRVNNQFILKKCCKMITRESIIAELSPALAVHTGPGTAGLCFYPVIGG
jgi:fatty acid-binding protein DegV